MISISRFKGDRRDGKLLLLEISMSRNCPSVGFLKCEQYHNWFVLRFITAVTTNACPRRLFPLCWNLCCRGRQSTISMVFSRALTEKVPSSLNEGRRLTRIISNDNVVFNYFIKMKDYVVKTTRALRAEWNSRKTKILVRLALKSIGAI